MTEYGKGTWRSRATERRAIRDEERARFAAEAGTTPLGSLDANTFSPAQQRQKIIGLLKVTRDGGNGEGHMEAMTMLARELARSGLGSGGGMASMARNLISPHKNTTDELLKFFLTETNLRDRK